MKTLCLVPCCLSLLGGCARLPAADFPQAEISNGMVRVKLYLPDPDKGYYRATRFDWSGVISSLQYKGHEFFGQWFPKYDPKLHDSITGPVESFKTGDTALGYDEAKAGETFIRIGVGVLRKPEEAQYNDFKTYEILDSGKWTVTPKPDQVEFVQQLKGPAGHAYLYKKTVRLIKGKPQLAIEHNLKNTGSKPIETDVYNHDFYMFDNQPTGPDVTVQFPFDLKATRELNGVAAVRGKEVVYLKELANGQSAFTNLEGFGTTAKDFDIRVENRKAGTGVREVGDQPISKVVFWSIRTTVCPEAYNHFRVEPRKEAKWKITYEFYELPKS
jgi:hypothetical protein